ncbi:MAG: 3-hydroxybutyryl-CoA dehydrogenase [Propionibacteriaceae bacterium]
MTETTTVGVVGLGAMGAGIAEVFARAGHSVIGVEYDDAAVQRGRTVLTTSTDRAVERGKLGPADRDALMSRVSFHTEMGAVADCNLVVEAVSERLDLKTAVFSALDEVVGPQTILATNTSSLSITTIAAATKHPERVVGVHFFNPAPVQTLVEVISTVLTAPDTAEQVTTWLHRLGKTTIGCGDRAGFVVNALLVGYLNRAAQLYGAGFCTRAEMDTAMVERAGYPMGPLTLLDLVGHDVTLAVVERLWEETRDPRHAPAPILTQLVAAGRLGRKTGRGFFVHGAPGHGSGVEDPEPVRVVRSRVDELPDTLVAPYLNDALEMVRTGYSTPGDIDTGMTHGCRMPAPFDVIAELGPVGLLERQRRVFLETAQPGHRPSLLLEELAAEVDPDRALQRLRSEF